MTVILSLPDEILDKILSYPTYDEVSRIRLVCKRFDASSQRVLNQGFHKVEKYHAQCLRKVKEQLPRRESERRKHPLSTHCDILTAIETRLSLLGMTFMKFVDLKYCCFIPGKVLDEIYKILRHVSSVTVPPRAHEILQELRDISSMAMEHFDEKIAPAFRNRGNCGPKLSVTAYGAFTGAPQSYSPNMANSIKTLGSAQEFSKFHFAIKQINSTYAELKKENAEHKRKLSKYRKKLSDQDRRITDQNNIIVEQGTRITEQEGKISEINRKFVEYDRYIADIATEVLQLREGNNDTPHSFTPNSSLNELVTEKTLSRKTMTADSDVNFGASCSRTVLPAKRRNSTARESKKKRQKTTGISKKV